MQRVDATTVTLSDALGGSTHTLDVPPTHPLSDTAPSASASAVPSAPSAVQIALQLPVALFSGPAVARDEAMMQLLQQGKDANADGDFSAACAYFEAAFALSVRAGLLVSAANMRLKLGQVTTYLLR